MDTALLIIDIQNDYFTGGKMELAGSEEAGKNAGKVLEYCRHENIPPVFIQHLSERPGAAFFIPGTEGAEINKYVLPGPGEKIITKNFPNSFRETGLEAFLKEKGITKLIICGMMTHMCVDATTRAAVDLGFEVTIVKDACATRDLVFEGNTVPANNVHASFLAALGFAYGKIVSADEFIIAK